MSRIEYPSVISRREICWACRGTGHRFAGVDPIRFQRCPICYGVGGRGIARQDPLPADFPQISESVVAGEAAFGPETISPDVISDNQMDNEANDFAAALLMPEPAFRLKLSQLSGDIVALAETFGVPEAAVRRRIEMLKKTDRSLNQ